MEVRPKAASNQMCKAHLHRNFPLSTFNLPLKNPVNYKSISTFNQC
ncbi:hypothetical protein SAMN04515624_12053 [Eubacterium maltosivorans]|nr:hypothetical protein EUMA32_35220 [Eubacterium maltosivorans]SDP65495.1 hypothetical protein SAMN04515624_12053 [Eubacterium maltosivorans]